MADRDFRRSIGSFQKSVEDKELIETLNQRDEVRFFSAIYDTANRKISTFPTRKMALSPVITHKKIKIAGEPSADWKVL
jgi:hypothetical protein